jgi:hypothetical protein
MHNSLIDEILGSSNAFDILGLPHNCTDPDLIHDAFLARQRAVSPERTRDPRSREAMKRVGLAHNAILEDLQPKPTPDIQQSPGCCSALMKLFKVLFFIVLIAKLFFGVEFHFDGFGSNDISREKLKGLVSFEMKQGQQMLEMNSARFGKKFYLPRWWAEEHLMRYSNGHELMSKLNEVADELWKEQLEIDCELEYNRAGKPGRQCQALNKAGFQRRP